jgi:hypothetical protein
LPHRRGHSPTSTYSFVLLVLLPHAFCAHLALTRVSAPPSLCVCVRSFRSPRWTDLMERAASSVERFASTQRTLSRGSFLAESVRFPSHTYAYDDSSLSHTQPSQAKPCPAMSLLSVCAVPSLPQRAMHECLVLHVPQLLFSKLPAMHCIAHSAHAHTNLHSSHTCVPAPILTPSRITACTMTVDHVA